MRPSHIPVLAEEVLTWLDPQSNQDFVDGTVGHGGHAELILQKTAPNGRLLAFDRDADSLAIAKERLKPFGDRVTFVHDSYSRLADYARQHGFDSVFGILLDLGFSSRHVDDASRGFSFQSAGPLDMRYDHRQEVTAASIINSWPKEDLAEIFQTYGEERHAHKIAKQITVSRKKARIETTDELADLIGTLNPRRTKIHPATRVFQALRIAVNNELGELESVLPQATELLEPGGRLAIISFHSLEDRIVKRFIKEHDGHRLKRLTKKPLVSSEKEMQNNPRSRSAKLRVAEKMEV